MAFLQKYQAWTGFNTAKDYLDVFVVPLIILLIGLTWPRILAYFRARAFLKLVRRELEEIKPHIPGQICEDWTDHLRKKFIHQSIVLCPSENRDFLLSVEPDVLYYLFQLWSSFEEGDAHEWLHFLSELSNHSKVSSPDLSCAVEKWDMVINSSPDT